MNNQSSNTNVLLLIIPNPSSTILPHSMFYKLFSEYGEVAKILIFEKARVWKAFIEMGNDFQARSAQQNLNGVEVIEGITMNVYFSALKVVTFLNNNCGGVDYSQMKNKNAEKKKLQLQQENSQYWYQANSQAEISYKQSSLLPQFQINYPMYHSIQNLEDYNNPRSLIESERFITKTFKSSTSIDNLKPSDSWLTPKIQKEEQFESSKKISSIDNLCSDVQTNQGSNYLSTQVTESKGGYIDYEGFMLATPNASSKQLIRLTKIKEEDMSRTESQEYYLNAVNNYHKDLGTKSNVQRHDSDADVEEHKYSDSQEEENRLREMMRKDSSHEGMSPDDQKIMNAFQSNSNYMYNMTQKPAQVQQVIAARKIHRTLTQMVADKACLTLEQEMNAQLRDMDISDFQQIFKAPPNLNQPNKYPNSLPTSLTKINFEQEEIIDPNNYVNPQFLIENQPSKVIYIRGLQHPSLSPVNIFNLLSNCGNVMVIIYIKQKSSVLVQFEKLNQAQNAKDHLNNMPFFGQKLKIFYSNYQQIQFPLPYQSPQTMVYIPSKDQFRFGEGKSISFNPPSQTLHLSNIKLEVTENEDIIKELFLGIGTVQAIKFMHLNQQKHMALVKLESIEEAMNGAALLHGKELFGRKINVSFTKSKL